MALQPWRELLGKIIADAQERGRLATALGINAVTLIRWAKGESNPRPQNLHMLLRLLPAEYREQMSELLLQAFPDMIPDFTGAEHDEGVGKIPSDFYASVIEAIASTSKDQLFFTVSNRILTQALGQIDPNNLGTALSVAQCMPPLPGEKVRSLREVVGRATPPWPSALFQDALFLGIESLAGYALQKGRTYVAEDRSEQTVFLAVRWEEWEESAIASPIMREGRFAGCLIATSTQPGYFVPFRQTLIERYALLMALAFEPEDFYDLQDIQLAIMPSQKIQRERTANFRQRLSQMILDASSKGQIIDIVQAQRLVWQQLEKEFLDLLVQNTG